MKKQIITLITLLIIVISVNAQNTFSKKGIAGIGITPRNSSSVLNIDATGKRKPVTIDTKYPAIWHYALPVIIVLMLIELLYSYKENKHLYNKNDTLGNSIVGVGLFLSDIISNVIVFSIYAAVYQYRLFTFGNTWMVLIFAFFANDFSYYWFHRISHHVNWFWASHVVHHSSEYFNLSTAFRQPWTSKLTGQFLFWLWMPLVGIDPITIILANQFCMIYQSWIHTELIHKMPRFFEFIFNTPSHHRVHHGSNLQYLDKNHGGILIIWDRLFGTFQEETEKPYYGLTKKLNYYNPLLIAAKEWQFVFKKVLYCGSLKNAINYLVQPPGWSHDGSSKTVKKLRTNASSRPEVQSRTNYQNLPLPAINQ